MCNTKPYSCTWTSSSRQGNKHAFWITSNFSAFEHLRLSLKANLSSFITSPDVYERELLLLLCSCLKPKKYFSFLACVAYTHNIRHVENLVKMKWIFCSCERKSGEKCSLASGSNNSEGKPNCVVRHLGHSRLLYSSWISIPVRQENQITADSQRAVHADAHRKALKVHSFRVGWKGRLAEENTRHRWLLM